MKYSTVLLGVFFTTSLAQHYDMGQSVTKVMGGNGNLGGMDEIGRWGHVGGHGRMAHSLAMPAGHMEAEQMSAGYMKSGQMRIGQLGVHHCMGHNLVRAEYMAVGCIGVGQMENGHVGSGQMRAAYIGTWQTGEHHRMGRSIVIPAGHTPSRFMGDASMTGRDMVASGSVRYGEGTGYRTARRSVLTTMGGTKMAVSNTKMSVSGPGITTFTMKIRGLMAAMMHD